MFTFHAFSSRGSPGFVSSGQFPTKLHSSDKNKLEWKYPGNLPIDPLYCIPDLRRLLVISPDTGDHWKSELFGGFAWDFVSFLLKIPACHSRNLNFSPQGQEPEPHPPPPPARPPFVILPKSQEGPEPLVKQGTFPSGVSAPYSSKEGNTTKPENKPTTETANKQVSKPTASGEAKAHFLLQNSEFFRKRLMTSPRQTTSSSM